MIAPRCQCPDCKRLALIVARNIAAAIREREQSRDEPETKRDETRKREWR